MNNNLNIFIKRNLLKIFLILPLIFPFYPYQYNSAEAALEFQWDGNKNYKKLKWFQKTSRKRAKNKIFFFIRPSDRRTGLLRINIKLPDNFKREIKPKKITLCRVNIGGFNSKTKCLENIPADIEIDNEKKKIDIYPLKPVPSDKESYAVVFNLINPQRSGLYQFHSFGTSSGKIPVSSYLGSWTIRIDQQ